MTEDAPAGRTTTMYPGGQAERARSTAVPTTRTASGIVEALDLSSHRLLEQWRGLRPREWRAPLADDRLGNMLLGRLVALRLTELEVHLSDLGLGFGPADWSADFVRLCLPMRFAWMSAHHHRRPTADHTIDGRWLFVCDDDRRAWLVTACGPTATVRAVDSVADSARCDTVVSGAPPEVFISGPHHPCQCGGAPSWRSRALHNDRRPALADPRTSCEVERQGCSMTLGRSPWPRATNVL